MVQERERNEPADSDNEERRKAWVDEHAGATTSTGEPVPSHEERREAAEDEQAERDAEREERKAAAEAERQERRDTREAERDERKAQREANRPAQLPADAPHAEQMPARSGSGGNPPTADEVVDRAGAEAPTKASESPAPRPGRR